MKILLVDDHAVIRSGLKQLCVGATVLEADNGASALALQKSERPGLTVLDLNMPGLSGLELLRQLLEVDSSARVLVFSMHGEPVYAAKALEIG
ncbi:MAG TPA: response regulator transcription factor, partial [Rhizomicrobium sp.]|nr:response regulator transcription factor [Rhizomicrobium sp.]